MKAMNQITVRLTVGCVIALSLTIAVHAQIIPVPPDYTNPPPTAEQIAAAYAAMAAAQQGDYQTNYAP